MSQPRSGSVAFRPRARLLKLIGSELISDDVVAITELIKNAHDADATTVTVEFRGVSEPGGEIIVRDDGIGMDLETVLSCWMQPASSSKVKEGDRVSGLGRRYLGEKGVGRFAADKLGSGLELVTRREGSELEIRALFDWDRFDAEDLMLEDIKNEWEERPATAIKTQGTVLRMFRLREAWSARMFRRLCARLARLRPPFYSKGDFSIVLDSDEFPDYSGRIRMEFLDSAPYHVEASFDGDQTIAITLNDGETVSHIWNGEGDLECGPLRTRIFAFDLESEALARIGSKLEVRGWLREWSGLSIYRDGFRLWPYGEPHDDWLRLDQRRVNTPVVRLSNNQVVGFVEISRDHNPDLRDQTNREGLVSNRAFADLRKVMYFVLGQLEAERQRIRHPIRRSKPSRNGSTNGANEQPLVSTLKEIAGRSGKKVGGEIRRVAEELERETVKERRHHASLIDAHTDLAAIGQSASLAFPTMVQLFESMRGEFRDLTKSLKRGTPRKNGNSQDDLNQKIHSIDSSMAMLSNQLSQFAELEGVSLNRRRTIDVISELQECEPLAHDMAGLETDLKFTIERDFDGIMRIEMNSDTFRRLINLLIANSIQWIPASKDPSLTFKVAQVGKFCEIIYTDNGPGIPKQLGDRVFEPRFSTRERARGMGLTLARQIVERHGGDIHVILDGRRKGAWFRIQLPRRRSRARVSGR